MARRIYPIAQGLGNAANILAQSVGQKWILDAQKQQQQGLLNQIFSQRDPRSPMPASQMSGNLEQDAFQQRPVFDEKNIGLLSQLNPQTLALLQSVHQMNQPSYFDAAAGSTVMEKTPQGVKPIYQVPQRQITPSGGDWQGEFNPGGTPVFKTLPGTNKTYQPEFKMQFNPQTQKFEKIYKGVEGTQSQGGSIDSPLSEADKKVVDSILKYNYPIPTSGFALRSPYWQRMIGAVMEKDPNFDATQYNTKQQLRKDFTSGKSAGNIRSLNTVAQHLDKLDQMGKELQNGNLQLANKITNFIKKETGNSSVTNFQSAANAVANEAVTVFKNTGATDEEIQHLRGIINENSSPQQISQYINTVVDLVNGRINALKNQYEQGMQKPIDFQMLDPQTVDIFKKRGISPADIGSESFKGKSDEDLMKILMGK